MLRSKNIGFQLVAILCNLFITPLLAQGADDALSHYAATYLLTAPSVRAMGMGDAFVAVADDSQAIFYNPAGLAMLQRPEFGSMFAPQDENQKLWSVEYVQPLGSWGGVGGGLLMEQITQIEARQAEFDVPFNIDSMEGTGLLSYGYPLNENWSLGATTKYLFHRFTNIPDHGYGLAFDLGTRYRVETYPGLTLGLTLQNLGGRFVWSTGKTDPILFLAKAGAGYQVYSWLLAAAGVDFRGDRTIRLHAGVESTYSIMTMRVGANHDHPTLGFGLSTPTNKIRFRFDYGFEFDPHGLANVNRFGFTLRF